MRTGLYFDFSNRGEQHAPAVLNQILEQVELADYLGYDSCLFADAPFAPNGLSASAAELIGALAASTHGIRLGTANRRLGSYHPARAVENYAVLDQLSNGRVICGVSAVSDAKTFGAFGVDVSEAESRFVEALAFMRRAWSHDAFAFKGAHTCFPRVAGEMQAEFEVEPYQDPYLLPWQRAGLPTTHLAITPRPLQLPYPPIWWHLESNAGVAQAAAQGLSVLPGVDMTHDEVADCYQAYVVALNNAGRAAEEVERPVIRDVFVAASKREALELVGAAYGEAHGGMSEGDLLTEHLIVGDPDEVFAQIKQLQQRASFNHIICRTNVPGVSHLDVITSMKLFAGEVITRLRS